MSMRTPYTLPPPNTHTDHKVLSRQLPFVDLHLTLQDNLTHLHVHSTEETWWWRNGMCTCTREKWAGVQRQ